MYLRSILSIHVCHRFRNQFYSVVRWNNTHSRRVVCATKHNSFQYTNALKALDMFSFSFYNFVDVVGGRRNINNARLRCSRWMCAGRFYAIPLEVSICIYIYRYWCTPVLVYCGCCCCCCCYYDDGGYSETSWVFFLIFSIIPLRLRFYHWFSLMLSSNFLIAINNLFCVFLGVSFTLPLSRSPCHTHTNFNWFDSAAFFSECVRDRKPRNGLITTREMCLLTTNMGSHAFYSVQGLSL